MTERKTKHDTFIIERQFPQSPARVFNAFSDPTAKARWFSGPAGQWQENLRQADFRVGGRERLVGTWQGGKTSSFDAYYLDIVPDERIVYAYDLELDGRLVSVSLATIQLHPDGSGTRLVFTEHGAFLDGLDDPSAREHGTGKLVEAMERVLRTELGA